MRARLNSFSLSVRLCLFVLLVNAPHALAQQGTLRKGARSPLADGRRTFGTSCAGCHGLDGRGSDKASNIAKNPEVQQLSDEELSEVISNGVPETGMPAFRSLGEKQIRSIIAYLRSLQGTVGTAKFTGNAGHGREIFFGKGNCANCHAIAGEGRFLGPDLTRYAETASPSGIRGEIVKRSRVPSHRNRSAVAVTTNGDRLEGMLRNEDNFSVQLQTQDGSFHLLSKSDLRSLEILEHAAMPTNYAEELSTSELDDLVSYLLITATSERSAGEGRKN